MFKNAPEKPRFDVRDDVGEEASFFDGRVNHDVWDTAGIFLKVHHGQNSSETPVTEDVPRGRVAPSLLAALDAALYAPARVFTGLFADDRGFDAVTATRLGYDVARARA